MSRFRPPLLLVLLFASAAATAGPNVALDNILLSKVNGVTKVEIWPGCTMRYVDHSPSEAGLELRIRVAVDPTCSDALAEVISERYSPSSLRLGKVNEVVFDRLSERDTFITLLFREPQKFEVRQHQVGWIEVFVDTNVASASLPAATPAPLTARTPPPPRTPRSLPEIRDRRSVAPRASARINVPPSSDGDYVVQLGVFSNAGPAIAALERSGSPHFAYTTRFEVNGTGWHGLKLGFFNSESEAEQVLAGLSAQFPDAWIRIVGEAERSAARAGGEIRDRLASETPAVRVARAESPGAGVLDQAMIDGRIALLEQRYADAVRHYTLVLESPDHAHGPEAREMLGLALERSGNTRAALAEYQAFLNEYPEHMMTGRVTERLTTLSTAYDRQASLTAADVAARRPATGGNAWVFHGGVSHYYWRNEEQVVHDGNYLVSSSGVLGLADITASRRGDRFDLLARFNGAYQHNLVSFDSAGDVGWVSDAFIDIRDSRWGWQGRFGRQTRRQDGIPGRFDGFGLSYEWRPDVSLSVSAGVPVDSPRFVSNSERVFVAGSARVNDLWDGRISASVYTHQQTVDGIYDRQAVGAEVSYREGNLSAFSIVDFDTSYNVLNTFLSNVNWRMDNGWTLSGRIDVGALPYLTTRNALSGQLATSIDELLDTFSEGQVRRLARDRTAQTTTASIGVSVPFGERFDLSVDVSMRQADGTEASGGVAAIPDTGNQIFFNAMLVGTSLLRDNDLLMLTLRSDTTRSRDTNTLIIDSRLPFGRALRINPRLSVAQHSPNVSNASKQTIVTPAIRILYRWNRVLVDLEAGARWSNRELPLTEPDPFTPDGTEELLGGFVNLGYRLEF
ncbi:MAG: SPOR domain-containing protein [Pseudomonadota bacterium]